MRVENSFQYPPTAGMGDYRVQAAGKSAVVLNPELVANFDSVITPKDKKSRVTEGELFAGVAVNRILKHCGTDVANAFMSTLKLARKSGKSLYQATRYAFQTLDTTIERTQLAGDPLAAKKSDKLVHQIYDETVEGCQINYNKTVSDPKKTNKGSGLLVSRPWEGAYKMAQDNLRIIDERNSA